MPFTVCFFITYCLFCERFVNLLSMKTISKYSITILLFIIMSGRISAQSVELADKSFEMVKTGFEKGSVNQFSQLLAGNVYLGLGGYHRGYFSSSQAYTILDEYFELFIPISFEYTKVASDSEAPYASGEFRYIYKGVKSVSKFYLALKSDNNSWTIAQLTVH